MANTHAAHVDFAPDTWNDTQLAIHSALTLEEAFHNASCLAGGWYRRPVAIDMQITSDNDEIYTLRPADVAPDAGWERIYEIKAVR